MNKNISADDLVYLFIETAGTIPIIREAVMHKKLNILEKLAEYINLESRWRFFLEVFNEASRPPFVDVEIQMWAKERIEIEQKKKLQRQDLAEAREILLKTEGLDIDLETRIVKAVQRNRIDELDDIVYNSDNKKQICEFICALATIDNKKGIVEHLRNEYQ